MASEWLDRIAYPFKSRQMVVASHSLHYIDEGKGSTIVFVHGTPTWSFEFRHLIRALASKHRCIALDHLGFGFSARPVDADYSPEAHAARFSEFMDKLDVTRVTLVVHDFGGPIALDWAEAHPERVEALVVLNSWMWPFDDDPKMSKRANMIRGALGRFLYRHFNASLRLIMPSAYGDKSKLTKAIHRQYLNVFPDADSRERVLFALARSLLGSSGYFSKLWDNRGNLERVPVRLIWGMKDSAFEPYILDRWVAAFPRAEVHRILGAGHWPHEERPEEVIRVLSTGP